MRTSHEALGIKGMHICVVMSDEACPFRKKYTAHRGHTVPPDHSNHADRGLFSGCDRAVLGLFFHVQSSLICVPTHHTC